MDEPFLKIFNDFIVFIQDKRSFETDLFGSEVLFK